MPETRKLAAILAADVAGYSKLAGADEERTLARLRALRSDLIDPPYISRREALAASIRLERPQWRSIFARWYTMHHSRVLARPSARAAA